MKNILFIMPFGVKNNIDFDETYEMVSKKIAENDGYSVYRVDKITSTNDIDSKMYKSILAADIVVADISLYNPNVLYELGIRHSLIDKTTKIIQKFNSNDSIPFDINHTTVFSYSDDWESLSSFILEEELDEIDSVVRKSVEIPLHNFNLYKSLFLNWENNYKKFNNQIKAAKKEKKYDEILKIVNKFEHIFGEKFEPLALEKALATYKSNEEDMETLLEAKKILEKLNPNFESSTELLGLISSINNRLLKLGYANKEKVHEFVSKLYFSKKTMYTVGVYAMAHIELGLNGYFSKKYILETVLKIQNNFADIDASEDMEYVKDTKALIDYILDDINISNIEHTTTKNNLKRIREWKEKND